GFLTLTDIPRNNHVEIFPVDYDRSRRDFNWNLSPIQSPHQPLKPMRLLFLDEGDYLRRSLSSRRPVHLKRWRKILRPHRQYLLLILRAYELDRRLVAIPQHD